MCWKVVKVGPTACIAYQIATEIIRNKLLTDSCRSQKDESFLKKNELSSMNGKQMRRFIRKEHSLWNTR